MKLAKLLLTLVLASFACLTVANPMWEPDLPRAKSAFEKETRVPLRAGHYIEPTLFKGFMPCARGRQVALLPISGRTWDGWGI